MDKIFEIGEIVVIDNFSKEFHFLSNFYFSPFDYNNHGWATVEHAYQAHKTLIREEFEKFLTPGITAAKAKRMGRKVTMRSDWDEIKLPLMEELVLEKFRQHSELKERLLLTEGITLVEGNTWGTPSGESVKEEDKII